MHVFFFKPFLFAWIFFLFFPHPPHHFSNGPSLSLYGLIIQTQNITIVVKINSLSLVGHISKRNT
jgi:hypothetical protein